MVRTRDQVTRYRRSGSGPAVLVLRDPDDPASLWPELGSLDGCCRLIAPEVTGADTNMVAWLMGFLEALGIGAIAIVAAERYSIPATELALLEVESLKRLVLVAAAGSQPPIVDGVLTSRGTTVPLLVVGRDLPAGEALRVIEDFLHGRPPRAG